MAESRIEGQAAAEPAVEQLTSDCSICRHPEAASIDAGLLGGTSLRSLAETHAVSRSALHRHKSNHLSVQTITDDPPPMRTEGIRLVEVHGRLADLADRLEKVVELATRTRKAPAAVAAMRELRSTLEAISRIQADPVLRAAASLEDVTRQINEATGAVMARTLNFALTQFGFTATLSGLTGGDRERIVAELIRDCLREVHAVGANARFDDVDTSAVKAYVESQAVDRAQRVEAEVRRRVTVELARRDAHARPAIEARPVLAIEGSEPIWTG